MKESLEHLCIRENLPLEKIEKYGFGVGIRKVHLDGNTTIIVATIYNNESIFEEICALESTLKIMNSKHSYSEYELWTSAFILKVDPETFIPEKYSQTMLDCLWLYKDQSTSFKQYYQDRLNIFNTLY